MDNCKVKRRYVLLIKPLFTPLILLLTFDFASDTLLVAWITFAVSFWIFCSMFAPYDENLFASIELLMGSI